MYDHVNSFVDAFQMNPGSALACAWVLAGVLWKVAVALSVNQAASYAAGQGGGAAVGAAAASLVF